MGRETYLENSHRKLICYNENIMADGADKIAELKKRPIEELTSEERRLRNLNPFPKGVSGNPKGRKKGVKNWSTHFRKLMGDPDFLRTVIKSTPDDWQNIVGDTPADVIAAGIVGNALQEIAKTIKDGKLSREAKEVISLLNKLGYGDKVVHEADEESSFFTAPIFQYNVITGDKEEESAEES